MRGFVRAVMLAMSILVPAASASAESKVFGSWTAECDEALSCTATAFGTGGQETDDAGYRLRVSRLAGEGTNWSIRFLLKGVPQPMPDGELRISIDGGRPVSFHEKYGGYLRDHDGVTFGLAAGPGLSELFATLRSRQRLELAYVSVDAEALAAAFSLSDLAAALLWIDERQNRGGASQEVGSPSGVDGEARFTAPKETAAKLRAGAETECGPRRDERAIESYWLPGGRALHIVDCGAGAYNVSRLFFLDHRSQVDLMYFVDFYESWVGTNVLFNPENSGFDPRTGRLSSFYLGRGIGDCGSAGQWIWSGDLFRLIEFKAWRECDENGKFGDDWPVVYKYKAK